MRIVPNYLLVVSQNLGIFPLMYIKNPGGEESIIFSRNLFMRGITLVFLIIASSLYGLYVDMEAYFTGQKTILMKSTTRDVLADVLSLMVDLVVVFFSTVKKHPQFTEMCNILQTTDNDLHLRIQHPTFKWRIFVTYTLVTTLVTCIVIHSILEPNFVPYIPVLCISIVQAAWILQFTFLVKTITARFQIINKMVKNEIRKEILHEHKIIKSFKNYSARLSPSHILKTLIDSYSQLCVAVEQAKDFYSGQILGKVSYAFTRIVISLYYFLLSFQETTETTSTILLCLRGAWSITHALHLLMIVVPCSSLTDTTKETAPMISSLMNEDENGKNKEVLNQIVSAVATYLVVLLQMHTSTS